MKSKPIQMTFDEIEKFESDAADSWAKHFQNQSSVSLDNFLLDQISKKEIQKAMAVPLKKLEGMLALERQKDGTVKTVFAGSRDYCGSKTETKNS